MKTFWTVAGFLVSAGMTAVGFWLVARPKAAQEVMVSLSERGAWPLLDTKLVRSDGYRIYLLVAGVCLGVAGILAGLAVVVLAVMG